MNRDSNSTPAADRRARAGLMTAALTTLLFIAQGCTTSHPAHYASPAAAADAFVVALRANDSATLEKVLGPDSAELISSGDDVNDRNTAAKFLHAYDEQHNLAATSPDSVTLEVGKDGWPLPIPIVRDSDSGKWWFDTEAGRDEILNRRIGRNELDVIQVCHAIIDAQRDYAELDPNGDGVPEYAARFLSESGARNGLYWPTKEGEAPSPLGSLVASAVEEGYGGTREASADRTPYHGYCYHMLAAQGPHAEGGALDYRIQGRMIGGFAAVAYPAEYGDSGIMTFIVSHRGVVYQRDLGEDTARLAREMTSFDPGEGWKPVDAPADTSSTPAEPAK